MGKTKKKSERRIKKGSSRCCKKADVIIMCMGFSARLEGEEMDIEIKGFDHGDRTSLGLPDVQEN